MTAQTFSERYSTGMFSYAAEFLSIILLILLVAHYYDPMRIQSPFGRRYWQCLVVTGASMALNGACVLTIAYSDRVPLWLNMLLNTVYFAIAYLMAEVFTLYLLEKLMAHVYEPSCLRRAKAITRGTLAALLALLLINIPTGVIFYFDDARQYCRGPANAVGYSQAVVAVGLLVICYCRNRASVDKGMRRVIRLGIPMVGALIVFQRLNQHILLNGTIAVCLAILLFLNFQTEKIDRDTLTGLRNRRSFLLEAEDALKEQRPIQILSVSLCQFSAINLSFGYQRGDEVLYHIARWLEHTFGRSGRVFRMGPVTFLVELPYSGEAEAARCVAAVQQRFSQPWELGKREHLVEARVMELLITQAGDFTTSWLIECLEYGKRLLKRGGRDYLRFDDAAAAALSRRRYLTSFLQRSIEEGRIQVWYQPVYCTADRKFCSAEALVRLQDEYGAFISPAEFIPLAEESGLIEGINRQVMEKVCDLLERGLPGTLQGVSINLSMRQLSHPDFARDLFDLMRSKGIPVERLLLEITERMLISEDDAVRENFDQLARLDFRFFLDDFGTGYSNFSGVLQFPFTTIKLDKSLIKDLEEEKRRTSVEVLIDLFHRTGFEVVAEGIETEEQAEQLTAIGVDYLQGFYFARPMPEGELIRFMEKNS